MSRINDFLCQLLQAVDQYIADGERDDNCPEWFRSNVGICDNWSYYTDVLDIPHEAWRLGRSGLQDKFQRGGMGVLTPFNRNLDEYHFEAHNHHIWLNAQRVHWLRKEVKRIQRKRGAA